MAKEKVKERTTKRKLIILLANMSKLQVGLCMLVNDLYRDNVYTNDEADTLTDYIMCYGRLSFYSLITDDAYYWRVGKKFFRTFWIIRHIIYRTIF